MHILCVLSPTFTKQRDSISGSAPEAPERSAASTLTRAENPVPLLPQAKVVIWRFISIASFIKEVEKAVVMRKQQIEAVDPWRLNLEMENRV
jgi:hypothetical protein